MSMDSKLQTPANSPPPKPWERAGTANPGEIFSTSDRTTTSNRNALGRPLPTRSWEQSYGTTNYGGYGSTMNYNSGIVSGSGMYGSFGGFGGGLYGGGMVVMESDQSPEKIGLGANN
ncbi:hypothetical protein Q3G72_021186 [Acer saccharum]|nr:hypothetical protein Q3G72_021186 [Acer saccharum]